MRSGSIPSVELTRRSYCRDAPPARIGGCRAHPTGIVAGGIGRRAGAWRRRRHRTPSWHELPGGGEARPGQDRWPTRSPRPSTTAATSSCRPAPAPASRLAYLVPACCPGAPVSWPPPPRRSRTSSPARTSLPRRAPRPSTFDFAVLKGRSNYLCLPAARRGHRRRRAGRPRRARRPGPGPEASCPSAAWAATTPTGDRAELTWSRRRGRGTRSASAQRRVPRRGALPERRGCFAEPARRPGPGRRRLVVNTHLYGLDLAGGEGSSPSTTWS